MNQHPNAWPDKAPPRRGLVQIEPHELATKPLPKGLDYQGRNPEAAHAASEYVEPDAPTWKAAALIVAGFVACELREHWPAVVAVLAVGAAAAAVIWGTR